MMALAGFYVRSSETIESGVSLFLAVRLIIPTLHSFDHPHFPIIIFISQEVRAAMPFKSLHWYLDTTLVLIVQIKCA